jgi:hypothetical protein
MQSNIINQNENYIQKIQDIKVFNRIFSFLDEKSLSIVKPIFKKYIPNKKTAKKVIKDSIRQYILDFGKNNEKVKYFKDEKGILKIFTNIFNINSNFLSKFTSIFYKNEKIELDKKELLQFIQLFPKNDIFLSNGDDSKLKVSKYIINCDYFDKSMRYQQKRKNNYEEEEKNAENEDNNYINEYSSSNLINDKDYFPLKFISNINYWAIILCSGGYFAYGLFLKDKEIEHKSDHKYVVRKKAGKRQIVKDKSKNINSMGAQLRRANEIKHKENIELVLKFSQEYLDKCDCIFMQAPGINKNIFIGENRPLENYKNKLFNLTFNLPKANYTNICLAYKMLTSCYLEIKE